MIEFIQYQDYIAHNKTFNTVFATSVASLLSLFLGILTYNIGWLKENWGALIAIFLVAVPVIIFIRESTKYEGAIAYYCIWKDKIHGLRDRKQINEDYGKQHGINDLKVYLKEHEPDRRWNYHVYTKYMERLVSSRNMVLTKIAEEYAEKRSELNKEINNTNEQIGQIVSTRELKFDELETIKAKLAKAKTGAQEFHLENQLKSKQSEIDSLSSQKTQLKCQVNTLEDELRRYDIAFVGQKSKIEQDYKIRGDIYARTAIKTIEKHGLKYEVDPLVLPNYWIINPTRKEIK